MRGVNDRLVKVEVNETGRAPETKMVKLLSNTAKRLSDVRTEITGGIWQIEVIGHLDNRSFSGAVGSKKPD